MSINIIDSNNDVEFIYCDLCRNGDLLYKCGQFKQYVGWYCRNCYELTDEDDDEYNDMNYVLVMRMLKTYIDVSTPTFCKEYHNMKTLCADIKKKISILN